MQRLLSDVYITGESDMVMDTQDYALGGIGQGFSRDHASGFQMDSSPLSAIHAQDKFGKELSRVDLLAQERPNADNTALRSRLGMTQAPKPKLSHNEPEA